MNDTNRKTIDRLRQVTEDLEASSSGAGDCYAFLESGGTPDIESMSDTPEGVRDRMLEQCMGWRYEHPDRYSQVEAWNQIRETGRIVKVAVLVLCTCPTLDGIKVTGSSCPLHGLPETTWD